MPKETRHSSLRIVSTFLLFAGIIALMLSYKMQPVASLTGQGTVLYTLQTLEPTIGNMQSVLPAAPEPSKAGILAFGMLMMLLGFGMHAWLVVRKRGQAELAQGEVKGAKKYPRSSRRQMEVIWVERTIRL